MRKVLFVALAALAAFCWAAPVWAERMAVNSDVANIRSGPGTNFDVLWKVEKYHPLEIIEKKGNWYRFSDFEKDQGWVHKSLLGDFRAVVVIRPNCNVRSGPSLDNPILFTVEKGIPFKVIGEKGEWLHVEHADGDTGWIHASLVW